MTCTHFTRIVCLLTLLCATPALAQERSSLSLGGRAGANYHVLTAPTDPKGEPTLLFGNALTGFGPTLGVAARLTVLDTSAGALALEADLLYAWARGALTVEDRVANQRQRLTLETHQLRVPVLLSWSTALAGDALRARFGLGPELIAGLYSGATVESEGVSGGAPALETTPVTHLGIMASLGVAIGVGGMSIPVEFRATFDPAVPGSTRERFQGYKSLREPGAYQVGFDWQLGVLIGFDIDL